MANSIERINSIRSLLLIIFIIFLNFGALHALNKKIFLHKTKTLSNIWLKSKFRERSYVFLSLKASNETDTDDTATNETKKEVITEDQVKDLMKAEHAILKEEISKNKKEIKEAINKTTDDFNDKLNQSEKVLKSLIKSNHKKIKNALRKLEFQIKETSKQNDDVTSIILSKEINSKQKELQELNEELTEISKDIPKEFLLTGTVNETLCSSYITCGDCTNDIHCGWCNKDQICVDGDQIGPFYDFCSFYSYKKCNDNDCNNYKKCEDCINNPLCGWCKDLLNDVEGCLNHNDEVSVCPNEGWIQLGTNKNLCEFADQFSKSDFINTNNKITQEEKKLQIIKKKTILREKEMNVKNLTTEIKELQGKLVQLRNHYAQDTDLSNSIDFNDDLDEFELEDKNKTNKGNQTLSQNNTQKLLEEEQSPDENSLVKNFDQNAQLLL